MAQADVSIGVAGTLGPDAIGRIAAVVEREAFRSLWVNDMPGGDSLDGLDAAADATQHLLLSTGVIPVDRRRPAEIVAGIRRAKLPEARLRLGIGSGAARRGALFLVGDAVDELREASDARVLVGALGPKMRRLGAERADGILLSWLTPEVAREQAAEAHAIDPSVHVALYVRTAVHPDAAARLAAEADRYGGYPAYAANFGRLGIRAEQTVMDADTFAERIAAYRDTVDEVVLRVMAPSGSVDDHVRFVERAAEQLRATRGV